MRALLTIVAGLTLAGAGCSSAKRDIEVKAEEVRQTAATIRADAATIRDNAQDIREAVPPDLAPKVDAIEDAATRIDHQAERVGQVAAVITDKAQQVKDITPWWQTLLGMGFWGVVGLLIAIALAWYGLLPIVIRALAGLASKVPTLFNVLIPDSIRTSAKLDAEAFNPNDPTMTAAIAARRQADPRYDAAYRAFKKAVKP